MLRITRNGAPSIPAPRDRLISGTPHSFHRKLFGLLLAVCALLAVMLLSLSLGAKSIPFDTVIQALNGQCRGADCTIITEARLPRTLVGVWPALRWACPAY